MNLRLVQPLERFGHWDAALALRLNRASRSRWIRTLFQLGQALLAYPEMTVIWVTADVEAVPRRAARRAREFQATHASWSCRGAFGSRVVHISSDGALSLAGEKLVSVLAGNAI